MFLASFTGHNILQLIFYLAVLVGILFITFYVTRWIAGYQKSQIYNQNFEVIETLKVTNNKFLQIVRVGNDDYYVIAIGKDEIHMLGKLDKSQINFSVGNAANKSFSDVLAAFRNGKDNGNNSDED